MLILRRAAGGKAKINEKVNTDTHKRTRACTHMHVSCQGRTENWQEVYKSMSLPQKSGEREKEV